MYVGYLYGIMLPQENSNLVKTEKSNIKSGTTVMASYLGSF